MSAWCGITVVCSVTTQWHCTLMQRRDKNTVAPRHGYFWVSAVSFLWYKKHHPLSPRPYNSCWEGKDPLHVYPAHPIIRRADLRKGPVGSRHVFSDWPWVKFSQNNHRSCCWPWAALSTVRSGARLLPSLLQCWSHISSFSLPPPQPFIAEDLFLGYSGLEVREINTFRPGS